MSLIRIVPAWLALLCLTTCPSEAAAPPSTDLNQQFMAAIGSGDAAQVETLIAQGANVNKSAEDLARTPLMDAASNVGQQNMTPIVRTLLEHGADVDAQDKNGLTPLMFAMDISSANLLLAKKPHLNLRDDHGRTALLWAIFHEVPTLVKALLDQGANANDADKEGQTALSYAAEAKRGAQMIPLLLTKGVPVDGRDAYGGTALIFAAHEDLSANIHLLLSANIHLLLRAGADVNARDAGGETALLEATHMSADLPTLRLLLQAGADVNAQDASGETALKFALQNATGEERVARFLLQHGANPNIADKDGDTPMIQAITAYHAPAFLSFLVAHGAKINAQDKAGQTALMVAAGNQDTNSMARLLALRADPNVKDKDGATALFYAATDKYSIPMVASINPGSVRPSLPTPFSVTTLKAVKLLLAHRAKVNVRDKNGRTVLFYAKVEKHSPLVAELKKRGVQG